jgi:hypothetical protein
MCSVPLADASTWRALQENTLLSVQRWDDVMEVQPAPTLVVLGQTYKSCT